MFELLRDIELDQNPNAKGVMIGGMNPWTVGGSATCATWNLPQHSIAIIDRKLWAKEPDQRETGPTWKPKQVAEEGTRPTRGECLNAYCILCNSAALDTNTGQLGSLAEPYQLAPRSLISRSQINRLRTCTTPPILCW